MRTREPAALPAPQGRASARTEADASAQARALVLAFRQIMRASDLHSKRLAREVGLTIPQAVVLQSIRDMGEVTTGQIALNVNLSQATVTTILDRLEGRRLIERYRSAADRRVVHARLTPSGEALLAEAPPLLQRRFAAAFAALPATRRTRLVASVREIAAMMGADTLAAPLLAVRRSLRDGH